MVKIRKTDLKDPGSNLFLLNSLQNEEQHEGIENVGNFYFASNAPLLVYARQDSNLKS